MIPQAQFIPGALACRLRSPSLLGRTARLGTLCSLRNPSDTCVSVLFIGCSLGEEQLDGPEVRGEQLLRLRHLALPIQPEDQSDARLDDFLLVVEGARSGDEQLAEESLEDGGAPFAHSRYINDSQVINP